MKAAWLPLAVVLACCGVDDSNADQATVDALLSVVKELAASNPDRAAAIESALLERFLPAAPMQDSSRLALVEDFREHVAEEFGDIAPLDADSFELALERFRWVADVASRTPMPTEAHEAAADAAIARLVAAVERVVLDFHRDAPRPIQDSITALAIDRVRKLRGKLANPFSPELLAPMEAAGGTPDDADALATSAHLREARKRWRFMEEIQRQAKISPRSTQMLLEQFISREADAIAAAALDRLRDLFTPSPEVALSMPDDLIARHKAHEAKAQERRRRAEERAATRPERAGGRKLLRDAGVIMVGGRPVPPRFADADAEPPTSAASGR